MNLKMLWKDEQGNTYIVYNKLWFFIITLILILVLVLNLYTIFKIQYWFSLVRLSC